MRQRGRKSSASLAVVPLLTEGRQPPPPGYLNASATKLWKAIVADSPSGWFTVAREPLLAGFCSHASSAEFISKLIEKELPTDLLGDREKLRRYSRLLGMRRDRCDVRARNQDAADSASARFSRGPPGALGTPTIPAEAVGSKTALGRRMKLLAVLAYSARSMVLSTLIKSVERVKA